MVLPNSLKLSLGIIMPFQTSTPHPIIRCSSNLCQIVWIKGTCLRVLEIRRVLYSFSRFIRPRQPRVISRSLLRVQAFRVLSTRAWMDPLVKLFLMVFSLCNYSFRVFEKPPTEVDSNWLGSPSECVNERHLNICWGTSSEPVAQPEGAVWSWREAVGESHQPLTEWGSAHPKEDRSHAA